MNEEKELESRAEYIKEILEKFGQAERTTHTANTKRFVRQNISYIMRHPIRMSKTFGKLVVVKFLRHKNSFQIAWDSLPGSLGEFFRYKYAAYHAISELRPSYLALCFYIEVNGESICKYEQAIREFNGICMSDMITECKRAKRSEVKEIIGKNAREVETYLSEMTDEHPLNHALLYATEWAKKRYRNRVITSL